MDTKKIPGAYRGLSISALIFGTLGGVLYWWVPFGMVMGLSGLLVGLTDMLMARRRSLDYRLSVIAIVLSIATLSLDIVIAYLGLQSVTFGGP